MNATPGPQLEIASVPDPVVDIARALTECIAEWPPPQQVRQALVWSAVDHGRERRATGGGEADVFADYEQLREHLWSAIRRHPSGPGVASELILRLDAAISLATAAALRGYYQDVIERSGEWPTAVERLLWDWRITVPVRDEE